MSAAAIVRLGRAAVNGAEAERLASMIDARLRRKWRRQHA